jgi:hypothetical protein
LSGAVRIGIGSERPIIYRAGDSFHEEPDAHHTVSENASESQPANLLAVFIVDAEDLAQLRLARVERNLEIEGVDHVKHVALPDELVVDDADLRDLP